MAVQALDTSLESLMGRYAAGDEVAFHHFYGEVAPRLRRFFLQGGTPRAAADELLQQTFLRLHVARGRYHPGEPVLPWLFTIAYRVRVDYWRRTAVRAETFLDPEEEGRLAADPPDMEHPVSDLLRTAVAQLPEAQREVVTLHKFQGLKLSEVAEVVGSSEGAVKLRAHRAYAALKKILEPMLENLS